MKQFPSEKLESGIYTMGKVKESLVDTFVNGKVRGETTGFAAIDPHFSWKLGEVTCVTGYPQSGKCLSKGTKVIMFDGTMKNVEDIKPGDQLMGVDSTPRNVLSTTSGTEMMYWIRQNYGIDYRVNESHILSLKSSKNQGSIKRGDVANISVRDYLKQNTSFTSKFKGYKREVEFPERKLKIDPYWLGLWLGDGSKESTGIYCADPETVEFINEYSKELNLRVSIGIEPSGCNKYSIVGGKGVRNTLLKALRSYNLYRNKHIPDDYLYNTRENRLKLLAGLLDSDGYYNGKNQFEISQKRKALAYQIKYLCDSLGFRFSIREKPTNGTVYYRMNIYGELAQIPTKIKRKQSDCVPRNKYTGIKVEKDCVDTYYGFTIDGDHLFLLEDFTVTHNTTLFLYMMLHKAIIDGWKSCIFCPENMGVDRNLNTSPDDIFDELIESYVGKPINQELSGCMSLEEYEIAINFLKDYFFVIYPEEDHTIDCIADYQRHICMKYDCKFVFTDPFNSFDNDFVDREDQFIRRYLLKRNKFAKVHGVCDITSVHPSGKPIIENDILKHPTQFNLAGGNMWNNKCDNIISINRPEYPKDRRSSYVEFHSLKIKKQKLVGQPGMVSGHYLRAQNRYKFTKLV